MAANINTSDTNNALNNDLVRVIYHQMLQQQIQQQQQQQQAAMAASASLPNGLVDIGAGLRIVSLANDNAYNVDASSAALSNPLKRTIAQVHNNEHNSMHMPGGGGVGHSDHQFQNDLNNNNINTTNVNESTYAANAMSLTEAAVTTNIASCGQQVCLESSKKFIKVNNS